MRPPTRARDAGVYPGPARGALSRVCPKCEAPAGWRCRRKVGDKYEPMKTTHLERRKA